MQTKLKCMITTYQKIELPAGQSAKLRGFFANQDTQDSLLHGHREQGLVYRYPRVQYKILKKNPIIVAYEDGIASVYPLIMENSRLHIGGQVYAAEDMNIQLSEKRIGDTKEQVWYRFLTPWLCLNQQNFRAYEQAEPEERALLLEKILAGNILSLAKGFGITVENQLQPKLEVASCRVRFKDEWMCGFRGRFSVNYDLPELCGLGKSVSRGFGTVSLIPNRTR